MRQNWIYPVMRLEVLRVYNSKPSLFVLRSISGSRCSTSQAFQSQLYIIELIKISELTRPFYYSAVLYNIVN